MFKWLKRKLKPETESDGVIADVFDIIGSSEFKKTFTDALRKNYKFPNLDPVDERKMIDTAVDTFYILLMREYAKK